jgi:hypothetical protein
VGINIREGGLSFASAKSTITKRDDVAEIEVGGKQEFAAGATAQVPFSIAIPADAEPTVATPHAIAAWELEATVKRRLRGDFDVKTPVAVFNGPTP